MTGFEGTLVRVARFLDRHAVPYMVIGGVANLVWGISRATVDVDLTVWVAEDDIPRLLQSMTAEFELLVEDPPGFVRETRVLPAKAPEGFRIDFIFGQLPYEEMAIKRAVARKIHGVEIKICSPEDLIIHKIISERSQDQQDVRGVIKRIGSRLDRRYLDPIVRGLASDLERPEIWERYQDYWREDDN
ncbi:MAG: nucleotidyl transferase AbiEii/AbiGii toxin family protein [Bacillota bacterium]|nr:nucleotidyl transferase AbiEii/AbiGii toxin family protein [Bacillota bacterium]